MPTFTLAANKNFDDATFATRAGNDIYTVPGNYRLTVDTDTRYCANSDATKGNLARVNLDYGELYIDGTNVRIIPYNTGSGNVPAIGTTVSLGGVSAYLLGVWSALNVAPTAAGAAMPASGWIKVKNKTGGNFSAGALTGIGASATGADVVGWIEVVGLEGAAVRDNSNANFGQWGKFTMGGAWFDVGTTSGSSATTYQLPASLANTYYPGVFVDELNNGNYRFWPAAGSAPANNLAADERGQVCWISSQGLLRFGTDGTNTGGMVPVAGLAIKVPNIVLLNATSAAMNVNAVPNATMTTRYSIIATLGGTIDIDKANINWNVQNAGVWSVANSGVLDQSSHTSCLTSMVFDNGGVGQSAALVLTPMNISGVIVPQTYNYWRVARSAFTATAQQCWNLLGVSGATLTNCRGQALSARFGSSNRALTAQNFMDSTVSGFEAIGCDPNFNVGMTSGVTITNTKYADTVLGTVGTTNPTYAITVGGNDVVVDGVSWLISTANTCQAYSGVVGVNTCDGVKVRNIGSMASPLDLGSTNGSANILDPGVGGGFSRNLVLQRIFCQNTRTGILGGGSAPGIIMDNVWGDTADQIITNKRNGTLTRSNRGTINAASGNAIGSHFYDNFTSTTAGQFSIFASEKTSDPNSAASLAITAGTPSMGGYAARMQTVGDQITWETPHWIRGHTGFANSAPSILVTTGLVASNLTVEFDLNKGSGFSGSWTTATGANLAAVSGINTTTGFKIRVRVTTNTANTGTWSRMTFTTTTTSSDQQALHPLEVIHVSTSGPVATSKLAVWDNGGTAVGTYAVGTAPEYVIVDNMNGTATSGTARLRMYGYGEINTTWAGTYGDVVISLLQTANSTVQASYATAVAYTGITVSWGASLSPTTLTADQTFQTLYDYTQAASLANMYSVLPLTGVGVAGAPSLFAAANLTINTTKKLNGAGSISMGSYTLSTEFSGAVAYTYTGGTWSQASTVPSFAGGQLNIGAAGTYTFTLNAAIMSMTPAAPGTYALGGCTFVGTVDLRNTTAHAITVQLPTGTSYTTASNTGGTITVTTPSVNQSVAVSGISTTMRIQIYDTTSSAELYNGMPGATSYTWTDSVAAAASRAIRLRVMETDTTPGMPIKMIDQPIGTCGTSSGNAAIAFACNTEIDPVYDANAIDGSTVTGITIDDGVLLLEIASGSVVTYGGVDVIRVSAKTLYSYETYWLGTEEGIRDEARFINAIDPANYELTDFRLKNTTAGPVYPVLIVDGYVRDSATGVAASLIDYAGGPIHFAPDHVVNNVITVSGASVITGDIADIPTAAEIAAAAATAVWNQTLP